MVAYSFMKFFVPQIERGLKRQTVRTERKRHARPGEAVQLYFAQRTKHCRKIVDPDPICWSVEPIRIEISDKGHGRIEGIEIAGVPLPDAAIGGFAACDGFNPLWIYYKQIVPNPAELRTYTLDDLREVARLQMGKFWKDEHGIGGWQGALIKWLPAGVAAAAHPEGVD